MVQLSGNIAFLLNARKMMTNDWKRIQAKSYAEAGVWLAIEQWEAQPHTSMSFSFPLNDGSAGVTLKGINQLEIRSEGRVPPYYVDRLFVLYEPSSRKVLTWSHVVGF
ncbi:hypothetical protein [Ammoniphilus sp. 3BR4]|uniref:hypothetical protein n=1 Tax=Ammoniphilus sp. 3BR4 TaxID=3158265 RepID=UPI0034667EE1